MLLHFSSSAARLQHLTCGSKVRQRTEQQMTRFSSSSTPALAAPIRRADFINLWILCIFASNCVQNRTIWGHF